MKTDKEKEIGLGTEYPYSAQGPGECIIPDDYQLFGASTPIKIGDEIEIVLSGGYKFMRQLAKSYNRQRTFGQEKAHYPKIGEQITFKCRVTAFIDECYGKYAKDNEGSQVILEYDQMFPYMIQYLPQQL